MLGFNAYVIELCLNFSPARFWCTIISVNRQAQRSRGAAWGSRRKPASHPGDSSRAVEIASRGCPVCFCGSIHCSFYFVKLTKTIRSQQKEIASELLIKGDMDSNDAGNEVMTVDDVAAFLRLPKTTVWKLLREKKLPGRKIGKHYRVLRSDIEAWLRQSELIVEDNEPEK